VLALDEVGGEVVFGDRDERVGHGDSRLGTAGISFHPEESFEATADRESGRPTFTHAEASRLDSAMTTARTIADAHSEDICDVAMDSLMRARPDAA
jgi:hypothetical protein